MPRRAQQIQISQFSEETAAAVASWPLNSAEAETWAGQGTAFPVTPQQVVEWHADRGTFPFEGRTEGMECAYGQLWIDPNEEEIELARIIVNPVFRGVGIGCAFVQGLLRSCACYRRYAVLLRVCPNNISAIRCYTAAGFMPVSKSEETTWNQGQPVEYKWMRHRGHNKCMQTDHSPALCYRDGNMIRSLKSASARRFR